MINAWGFFIILLALPPSLGTHQRVDKEIAREFRGPYQSKAQCDYWQEEWIHHNGWLREFGIVARDCILVVKKEERE